MSQDAEKIDNVTPIRNRKGQFVKGASGNPTGKAPRDYVRDAAGNRLAVADLYAANAPKVFYELLKTIMDPHTPATAKVSGIKEFNDRAFGKSPASLVVKAGSEMLESDYDLGALPIDTLAQLIALKKVGGE